MDKGLGNSLHFWRFCAHANFTYLTSPPPHIQCWKLVPAISPNCIRWGGGQQRVFKRNSALFFSDFICKAQIIHRYLDLSSVFLRAIPRRHCVKSQLVSLPPFGFLNILCSVYLNKVNCVLFQFFSVNQYSAVFATQQVKILPLKDKCHTDLSGLFLHWNQIMTHLISVMYNLVLNPFILGMQVFHLFLPALASNCVKNWLQFQNQFQNCFEQHCWLFLFKQGQRCYQSTPLLFPLHYS